MNDTVLSETTGNTPFFLMYGSEPRNLPDLFFYKSKDRSQNIDIHWKRMILQTQMARDLVKEQNHQAQAKMQFYYDQHSKDYDSRVGQQVWVYSPAAKPGKN